MSEQHPDVSSNYDSINVEFLAANKDEKSRRRQVRREKTRSLSRQEREESLVEKHAVPMITDKVCEMLVSSILKDLLITLAEEPKKKTNPKIARGFHSSTHSLNVPQFRSSLYNGSNYTQALYEGRSVTTSSF